MEKNLQIRNSTVEFLTFVLDGKIVKPDVSIAKNYLNELELEDMGRLVNAVHDMAERMAKRHIPMTMQDRFQQSLLNSLQNQSLRSIGSFRTGCSNLISTVLIRICWNFRMISNN